MNTFDVNRLSTVVYTAKSDILYTSFKNTQDINKSFLNVDKNALNMYIALYSYTLSTTTKGIDKEEGEEHVEVIVASIKNKRKLLIGHYKEIYITILITDMIKYYELEVLKKGIKRILICMDFYKMIGIDYELKNLVEGVLQEVNIYKYFYKYDYLKKDETKVDEKVLIYDYINRKTVHNTLDKKLERMVLNWIDYKDATKQKLTLLEAIQSEFYKSTETQQVAEETILNKTFHNLTMPIQYTYEVLNEIIGLNKENVSTLMLQNDEADENIKINNTNFFNKVLHINDNDYIIWTYEGYISFMRVEDIEMSIMKEYDDTLLDRIKEYENSNKRTKEENFHYIIKKIDADDEVFTNFNVNDTHDEEANKWSLWLTKTSRNIKNLSASEYKKLFNHLLTILDKECSYEVKERMIKLKDYDLVIYLNVVSDKFVMLVKDKDDVKDYLSQDVQEFLKKI